VAGIQTEMFPEPAESDERESAPTRPARSTLNGHSSLWQAVEAFDGYMMGKGFTDNTRKAFLGDLKRLSEYVGDSAPLRSFSTASLNDFLN
jgi:hypothetical protein